MSFYRQKTVYKPKKVYKCDMCGKPIEGHHFYTVYFDYNSQCVVSLREHDDCSLNREKMCGKCEHNNDCQNSVEQCYCETYMRKGDGE